jgi:hypothetical protein
MDGNGSSRVVLTKLEIKKQSKLEKRIVYPLLMKLWPFQVSFAFFALFCICAYRGMK